MQRLSLIFVMFIFFFSFSLGICNVQIVLFVFPCNNIMFYMKVIKMVVSFAEIMTRQYCWAMAESWEQWVERILWAEAEAERGNWTS